MATGHARSGRLGHAQARSGMGGPLLAVSPAAETRVGIAKVGRVGPIYRTQIMEIFGPWAFLAALVGGQQSLTEPRLGPALADIPGADLGNYVSERDPQGQAVGTDPACPGRRGALVVDLVGDLAGHEAGHQAPRTDLPGQEDLLLRITSRAVRAA